MFAIRRIRFERRPHVSTLRSATISGLSIVFALIACGFVLAISGENPFTVYRSMLSGSLGDRYALSETLVKMTPLLITGVAVAIAFRMQLWNIGAEGQLTMGAVAASAVPLFILPDAPGSIMIPAMLAAAVVGGGLWGAVPGVLRARFSANETITTLMLNYVAILFMQYLVYGPWKDPQAFGFPGTERFSRAADLPALDTYRVHLGLVFGLVIALAVQFLFRSTRFGYELTVIGDNPRAARYAGMRTGRAIIVVLTLSGAIAGIAGMSEVAGIGHSLQRTISPGYGYTAIIVAWLARLNPIAIIVVSFGMATILVGSDQLQSAIGLPGSVGPMLQGAILFCLLASDFFTRFTVRIAPGESGLARG
ncbi:MAG: ABC transporter permease, partial [Chloroflexota bacterium]|nr:ABC transporter permease [Chloroflexota bacterium]